MIWFTGIFVFVGFIFPVIDYFWDKRIKRDLKNYNKVKTYKMIMLIQWSVVGAIFLLFWLKGISFEKLGFVTTHADIKGFLLFVAGILTSVILLILVYLAVPYGRKKLIEQFEAIEILLPVGVKERLLFAAVAVTAGFCEEVIFRGFMFYYLDQLGWGLSTLAIAIITSILFGLVHGYQGWKGIIFTGLIGFAMAKLYISHGSIWVPIILHIIIDLKFAVMPNLKKIFEKRKEIAA